MRGDVKAKSVGFVVDEGSIYEAGAFCLAEAFALKGIGVFFEGELGESGNAGEFVRGE